ncbi:hypothetical protein [Mesorhizobium sp.]|uniref:hypothetical protein n=1 Tax=Mesorhizobium sp. TaxID=1871066 RepID=UPI000FE4C8E7|nr:hypothetical protein [Mesorhizobium sp.]RWQ48999.1 MAG: hypothetical protein EOS83_24740 [Mesorhizobium sp.]
MSIAVNASGGLEVFARGRDNALWHKWQTPDGWSDWTSLGGDLRGGPAVARHAGGGLEVFSVASDGAVWHIWQTANGWSGWASLGGHLVGSPSVGMNYDKRLEVFARSPDGQLWHIWQKASFTEWTGWAPMGVQCTGNPAVGGLDGRNLTNGALCVFVVGPDRTLQFAHQQGAASSERWSAFKNIAGPITTDVSIGRSIDGRQELFYADHTGAMRHVFQLSDDPSNWSQPGNFGGRLSDRPAAIRNKDGRLEVFHRGDDGRLHNAWQTAPNNGWTGWHARELTGARGFPVAAMNSDGRLEVFTLDGSTGNVTHMWQQDASRGPWHTGNLGGERLGGITRGLSELGRCALWETGWA